MRKVFSGETLQKFEDASASITLRQIDRAFQAAHIQLGDDSVGTGGMRRIQFRRYAGGVDQADPRQLDQLGDALGALVGEVAASKVEYLVTSAQSDGFRFIDGAFRRAKTATGSFAITRVEDLASIDEHARRLHLLASGNSKDAIGGATEIIKSVCQTVLRLLGEPAPRNPVALAALAKMTIAALALVPASFDNSKQHETQIARRSLQQLSAVVASLEELRNAVDPGGTCEAETECLPPRYARLAVGAAATFASFIAETYLEGVALKILTAPELAGTSVNSRAS